MALTVKQAADALGFKDGLAVYRRIWSGELDASDIRRTGAKRAAYRITEASIEAYLERTKISHPKVRAA